MNGRFWHWRYRLARRLLGCPFFLLTGDEKYAWLVTRKGETTFGVRVTEWHGDWPLVWKPESFGQSKLYQSRTVRKGTFEGKFG